MNLLNILRPKIELDFDKMVDEISENTGIEHEIIEKILEAETTYLRKLNIIVN